MGDALQRIGVWLDSYGTDIRDALRAAAADGFSDVHVSAIGGPLAAQELSQSGRRHLAKTIAGQGLRLDGLGLDFQGDGLADPARAEQRLEHLRRTVALAAQLAASRVVVRVGGFAADAPGDVTRQVLQEAADTADRSGVVVAVLAAGGRTAQAAPHIRAVGCPGLMVALDTLDMLEITDVESVVGDGLGCVCVRDARRRGSAVEEAPFGSGDVDFDRLLAWMDQCPNAGPPVVRAASGPQAAALLRQGAAFLRARMPRT